MDIRTKEFNVSKDEFRHFTSIIYYKQIKILISIYAILTVMSIILAILVPLFPNILLAVTCVIILSCTLALPYIRNSAKTQIKLNFQNIICKINDNYFSTTFEDGSSIKIHFNNYIKATRESDWYFVYSTNTKFDYLPIRAFNSEDDINEFEAAMKHKKLMA